MAGRTGRGVTCEVSPSPQGLLRDSADKRGEQLYKPRTSDGRSPTTDKKCVEQLEGQRAGFRGLEKGSTALSSSAGRDEGRTECPGKGQWPTENAIETSRGVSYPQKTDRRQAGWVRRGGEWEETAGNRLLYRRNGAEQQKLLNARGRGQKAAKERPVREDSLESRGITG